MTRNDVETCPCAKLGSRSLSADRILHHLRLSYQYHQIKSFPLLPQVVTMPKRKASSLSCAPISDRSRRSKRLQTSSERRHSPTAKSPQHYLLSPPDSDVALNTRKSKRKREVQQEEGSGDTQAHEPAVKRRCSNDTSDPVDVHKSTSEQDDLTAYWVRNDFEWSEVLGQTVTISDKRFQKRSLSRSNSYTQSTRSGDTPKAWGAKHAAMMLGNGIIMEKQEGASITQDDEQLCTKILGLRFELPGEWTFYGDNFLTILKMALYKNEARVVRDVGPHVMPSPELHNAQGHPGLEHIAEGVDAQWTKCTSLWAKIEARREPGSVAGTSDSAQTTPPDDGYRQGERAQKSEDLTPDILDRLFESLNGRPQADAEDRLSQFHIWPSIRFVETTLGDDTATWSPHHCSTVLDTARYQVLPYFASYHWQLPSSIRSVMLSLVAIVLGKTAMSASRFPCLENGFARMEAIHSIVHTSTIW